MYIISKFKDYYDSVSHSKGIDKTIVYRRNTEEQILIDFVKSYSDRTKVYFPNQHHCSTNKNNKISSFNTSIIGFCGKLYPVTKVNVVVPDTYGTKLVHYYTHDLESVRDLYDRFCKSSWYDYFSVFEQMLKSEKLQNIFYQYKTPIFELRSSSYDLWHRISNNNLIINPCLKEYDFVKVIDPYSAFQEIEMYISGVLGVDSQKPIEVSDKSKIEGHGFDYKMSFRKRKEL